MRKVDEAVAMIKSQGVVEWKKQWHSDLHNLRLVAKEVNVLGIRQMRHHWVVVEAR